MRKSVDTHQRSSLLLSPILNNLQTLRHDGGWRLLTTSPTGITSKWVAFFREAEHLEELETTWTGKNLPMLSVTDEDNTILSHTPVITCFSEASDQDLLPMTVPLPVVRSNIHILKAICIYWRVVRLILLHIHFPSLRELVLILDRTRLSSIIVHHTKLRLIFEQAVRDDHVI